MITINELWNSATPEVWEKALQRYWKFVKPSNMEIEHRREELHANYLKKLDAEGWYEFLKDTYFRWKYTAKSRYTTTTSSRHQYLKENAMKELTI